MTITKLVFCVRKRPELSDEEFQTYWHERHGPLVRSFFETGRFPGMLRYVQSHWVQSLDGTTQLPDGGTPFYDGHAEHWFADREAYLTAMASPEWKLTLEDGPNGFAASLVGGELEETVISWHPMDDGRATT